VSTPAGDIRNAVAPDSAPRYLLRDRDGIYGGEFRRRVKGMGSAEALTAPRSPWQNPFADRVIGTIRHELLDHVIVLNEGHLRRRLRSYLCYAGARFSTRQRALDTGPASRCPLRLHARARRPWAVPIGYSCLTRPSDRVLSNDREFTAHAPCHTSGHDHAMSHGRGLDDLQHLAQLHCKWERVDEAPAIQEPVDLGVPLDDFFERNYTCLISSKYASILWGRLPAPPLRDPTHFLRF